MYLRTYVCMHMCLHVSKYVCTYVCLYVCMYICTYICILISQCHTYHTLFDSSRNDKQCSVVLKCASLSCTVHAYKINMNTMYICTYRNTQYKHMHLSVTTMHPYICMYIVKHIHIPYDSRKQQ